MAYTVLARKWRPKNFFELVGQDSVRQTLLNALKQKRIYPVLLFTGPRGTGKTSTARILAKSLRCKNQKDFIPCEKCEDCLFIQDSRHLDVIEIDGASNNGVEAVRELRDTINYMPSTGFWKIYIIDEVHMLSNSAFNALLKTFEEPPEHALFIMATTEKQKIPETVLSRTQSLDFHLLSTSRIKKQLEKICSTEKISFSEEVLWMISKQARGSLRDGQSLLDQVITFCGAKDANLEKVTELLGLSDPKILSQALKAIIHRKEKEMVSVIESLRLKSSEPRLFLQSLLESVRNLLFLKKNPENKPELVEVSQTEIEEMKKDIADISYEDLHFIFDILLKGEREMAFCYDSQLALEVLLLRFCASSRLESFIPFNSFSVDKTEVVSSSDSQKEKLGSNGNQAQFTNFLNEKTKLKKENQIKKNPTEFLQKTSGLNNSKKTFIADSVVEKKEESFGLKEFERRFDFLKFLREKDNTLSALVENLGLKEKSSKHFFLIVPEKFSYLKNKIQDPHCKKMLEDKLTEFLNFKESVKIDFSFDEESSLSLREEEKQLKQDKLLQQAEKNAFVNEVKTLFKGELKSVKPLK